MLEVATLTPNCFVSNPELIEPFVVSRLKQKLSVEVGFVTMYLKSFLDEEIRSILTSFVSEIAVIANVCSMP